MISITVPLKKKDIKNPTNASNSSCISDKNGNLLYRYGGNKLRDANENLIYSNLGAVMRSPALIPFPYDDKKTLFFHSVMGKGVLCDVINNNNPSDMQTLKTFSGSTQKFIFIQQNNTENIWFLSSVNSKIEISLITKDGFSETKVLDFPYDVSNAIVSNDNTKIIFRDGVSRSILFDFDNKDGRLSEVYAFDLYAQCEFSVSGKYIYNIEKESENVCNVVRYDIQTATDEQSLLESRFIIDKIPIMSVTQPKLAPDKNIYINAGLSLYAIYDCDTENAYLKPDVIKFDKIVTHLPYTFHYTFDDNLCNVKSPKIIEKK